ncbi:uncharacterized protein LOC106011206 [Aplysia californica]|uniref:Uncharacterized protein LOC106011206 n=1 Tax=Aplysia californica TaxID=6500 RepID=A0ABM0ZVL8_APLCA|nr:uncharacterized protein LOC106011206 [Aplysia californica]
MMPSRSPKVFFTFLVLSSVCILWIVSSSWNDGHIWFQPQQTRGSDPDMEQATLQATAGRPASTDNYSPVVSAEVQRSPDLSSQEENVFTYPSAEVENLFMRVTARNNCGSVLSLNESGWRSNDVLRLKTAEIDYQRMNQLLE